MRPARSRGPILAGTVAAITLAVGAGAFLLLRGGGDGDGADNRTEFLAYTHPLNNASKPTESPNPTPTPVITPFRTFAEMGLSLSELSALYMGRVLLECLAASPFRQDLACAFEKLELALTPRMCAFLDKLPGVLRTKSVAQKRATQTTQEAVARLLQASLEHRRVRMRYQSFASGGARKTYLIEPYRLVCAEGGRW